MVKIRRPDADKARKHLERQHMDAAARAARVVRPRRAPGGMPSVETLAVLPSPEALNAALAHIAPTAAALEKAFRKAAG